MIMPTGYPTKGINRGWFKKGITPINKGKSPSKETIQKMVATRKGNGNYIPWNKGLKGAQVAWNKGLGKPKLPKIKQIPWNKGLRGVQKHLVGSEHPNWKGGKTPLNKKIRHSLEYRIWREAVFERDNWTCQACELRSIVGVKVYLQAHHIKPFAFFPELRFAIDNGVTLCRDCHKETDSWGRQKQNNLKTK